MMQQLAQGVDVLPGLLRLKQLGVTEATELFGGASAELWSKLPQLRGLVFDLMRRTEGVELVQVTALSVGPGQSTDLPMLTDLPFEQYCLVLQGEAGAQIRQGEVVALTRSGAIWWVGKAPAQLINNTGADWIGLLIWIRH